MNLSCKTVQNVYKYKTIELQDVLEYNLLHWRIEGGARDARPLSAQFSFLCSFRQKSCQIIGFYQLLKGWRPLPVWEILDPSLYCGEKPYPN